MPSIFTKIVNGEIPSTKVYEDDICLAFLDINPVTKGHTLLIPKKEYVRMTDVPDDLIAYLFNIAKQLMQQMKDNLWADFVRLYVDWTGVPHVHIHLIPSKIDDKAVTRNHSKYQEWEAQEIADKIVS